jgi:hypothetical protein
MSSSNLIRIAGRMLLAGVFLATASGCTSLTQADDIKINKDAPVSPFAEPVAAPAVLAPGAQAPTRAQDGVQKARNAARARPGAKKPGSG